MHFEEPTPAAAGFVVTALHDYAATEEGELNFAEGDQITVTHQDDSGWWQGTNPAGEAGLFPSNYTDGAQ